MVAMPSIKKMPPRKFPPVESFVLDCHAHVGFWHNFFIPWPGPGGMVEVMDACGMDTACVTAHAAIGPDFRRGNDAVIEAVEKFPGYFKGYVTVNPGYEDELVKELERCFSHGSFIGIKIHPLTHQYSVAEGICVPVLEYADSRGLPILSHTWDSARMLGRLSEKYRRAKFLVAHASSLCAVSGEDYLGLARERDNVFLDTASSSAAYGTVERLVDKAGADKILFGTDFPFIEAAVQLGAILWADVGEDARRKILGGNMKRIIGS